MKPSIGPELPEGPCVDAAYGGSPLKVSRWNLLIFFGFVCCMGWMTVPMHQKTLAWARV
jgi:hypothetical protein